ncbi:MAG: choice-of-anchor tandem repeat NxxGxxAF-containing protein [Planctomycetota bacterium]
MATGPAPGFGANVFVSPSYAGINESGDLVFQGYLSGAGVTNDNHEALWVYQDATGPVLLARTGRPAAGYDIFTTYEDFTHISIDDSGVVAFGAFLEGPEINSSNDTAYWSGTPVQLDLIASHGAPIPGTDPAEQYWHLSGSFFHGAGGHWSFSHAYRPSVAPETYDRITMLGMPDALMPYWSEDGQGVDTGFHFTSLGAPQVNASGQLAYGARTFEGAVGIYTDATGTVQEIARLTQQAPGFDPFVTMQTLNLHELLDNGAVSFFAELVGPGVHVNSDRTYWVADPGQTPRLMIREWEYLPYQGGTARLRILEDATHNENGNALFTGRLNGLPGESDYGVWFGSHDNYELVIQEGDTDPGISGMNAHVFYNPVLNDRDLVVVSSQLRLDFHQDPFGSAVWAYRDGVRTLVVATGMMVNIASPGETPDFREVEVVASNGTGLDGGSVHVLNDADQLALLVYFTDDTQALIRYDLTGVFAPGDPGDLTGDGFVGVEDLDVLLANWGNTTFAGSWRDGDADGDGVVGQGDLNVIRANWSTGTPPGGVVPEPAGAAMLLALIGLATRRRRR